MRKYSILLDLQLVKKKQTHTVRHTLKLQCNTVPHSGHLPQSSNENEQTELLITLLLGVVAILLFDGVGFGFGWTTRVGFSAKIWSTSIYI